MLKEAWLAEESPISLLEQVADLHYRLVHVRHFAPKNLEVSQQKMKTWYDKRAKSRSFTGGERVIVLLTTFTNKYFGPYAEQRKLGMSVILLIPALKPGRVIRVTFSQGHPGLTRFTIYPGLTRIGSREKRNCSFDDVELINAIA